MFRAQLCHQTRHVRATPTTPRTTQSTSSVASTTTGVGVGHRPRAARTRVVSSNAVGDVETQDHDVVRRRAVLTTMTRAVLAACVAHRVPLAAFALTSDDADDDASQEAIEAQMRAVMERNSGEQIFVKQIGLQSNASDGVKACAFEISNLWRVGESTTNGLSTEWGEIIDPVNGEASRSARVFATTNFGAKSIADLGKPEDISVAKALGLDGDDSYRRADMLGAAKRVDKSTGQVYYDWELVASPPAKSCPSAVGCLYPEHIYLISASILDGVLYVLSIDATPANWRTTGSSMKRMRNSFVVGYQAPTETAPDAE